MNTQPRRRQMHKERYAAALPGKFAHKMNIANSHRVRNAERRIKPGFAARARKFARRNMGQCVDVMVAPIAMPVWPPHGAQVFYTLGNASANHLVLCAIEG